MKHFRTIIEAKYGEIHNTPPELTLKDGISIKFELVGKNNVGVDFFFEDTTYTKDEAEGLVNHLTKALALSFSFHNKLCFNWSGINDSTWEIREGIHTVGKSISARACIIRGALLADLTLDNIPTEQNINTFEAFNKALYYNEQTGKDNEVAFWIWIAFESIQMSLNKSEQELERQLKENNVITEKDLSTYKFSIGSYYRHKKGVNKDKEPFSIQKCIEITHKIITFEFS